MSNGKGGFIGQDGLNAPDPATGVTGTAGDKEVTVSFTAPSDVGGAAITGYNVQAGDGTGIPNTVAASIPSSSYASVNFSVATQDTSPTGLTFKSDGSIMYVSGDTGNVIEEYALSTAWDVSTASHTSSYDVSSQTTDLEDVTFKTDGTKMYVLGGGSNDTVYQYSLSSAWDSSGASYESKSFALNSQDTSPTGLTFKSDGTKMYVTGNDGDTLEEYTLSSAWDVSTATTSHSLDISGEETSPEDVEISSDGKYIYVAGGQQDGIDVYALSTAYDLSTASYVRTADVSGTGTTLSSCFVNISTGQFWSLDKDARTVSEYTIGAFSYPTASPVTITGLTNGTSYTFNVWAINPFGWSSPSDASNAVSPEVAARALFFGGYTTTYVNTIDFVEIPTTGNATDFGDLSLARIGAGSTSSSTRAVCMGGFSSSGASNVIDYVTVASAGNATDFGDLQFNNEEASGCGSGTRGIMAGGVSKTNAIQYITIASTGNAVDFGDLVNGKQTPTAFSGTTRSCIAGGNSTTGNYTNEIDYITTATTGNASDFGDLTLGRQGLAGAANSTRGVMGGGAISGDTDLNTIDYVTIATTGNAVDFGDLTNGGDTRFGSAAANATRALLDCGGLSSNKMEFVTIASTGNGTDFGNLTQARRQYDNGASNGHGGIS